MHKIQMPIGMFDKGSVIYVDYPYEDKTGKTKRRPAVVIDYNTFMTKVVVLKVTTTGVRTPYDYQLKNPDLASLKKGSVVRCNHTLQLPNEFRCEKHGALSRNDMMAVSLLYYQAISDSALVEMSA